MDFHATAENEKGDTFMFFFSNQLRMTTEQAAQAKLDQLVAADELHQKYGPWHVESYDVGGA